MREPPKYVRDQLKLEASGQFRTQVWNDLTMGDRVIIDHARAGHWLDVTVQEVERKRNCVMLNLKVNKVYDPSGIEDAYWEKVYKLHDDHHKILRWKKIPDIQCIYVWQAPVTTPEGLRAKLAERAAQRKVYVEYRHVITELRGELGEALSLLKMDQTVTKEQFQLAVRNIMKDWHPDREAIIRQRGDDVEQFRKESLRYTSAIALVRERLFAVVRDNN